MPRLTLVLWLIIPGGLSIITHINRPSLGLNAERRGSVSVPQGVVLSAIHIDITTLKQMNFTRMLFKAHQLHNQTVNLCIAARNALKNYLDNLSGKTQHDTKFANLLKDHMCNGLDKVSSEIGSIQRTSKALAVVQEHILNWIPTDATQASKLLREKRDISTSNVNIIADRETVNRLTAGKTLPGLIDNAQAPQNDQGTYGYAWTRTNQQHYHSPRWEVSTTTTTTRRTTTTSKPTQAYTKPTETPKPSQKLDNSRLYEISDEAIAGITSPLADEASCPAHCKNDQTTGRCAKGSDIVMQLTVWNYPVTFFSHSPQAMIHLSHWITSKLPRQIPTSLNSRKKRGVLNFVGWVYNGLFGLATDDQVDAVQEKLMASLTLHNMTAKEISDLQDKQIVLSDMLDKGLKTQSDKLNELMSTVEDKLVSISGLIQMLGDDIDQVESHLRIHDIVSLSQAARLEAQSSHHRMSTDLQLIRIMLDGVLSALITHNIPPYLVSTGAINDIIISAMKVVGSDSELIPSISKASVMTTMKVIPNLSNNTLLLTLALPYRQKATEYSIYEISSLPIYVGGRWLRADLAARYVLVDLHREIYTELEEEKYEECVSSPMRTCIAPGPWRTLQSDKCLESLLYNWDEATSACKMTVMSTIPTIGDRLIRLPNGSWNYSPPSDGAVIMGSCLTNDTSLESNSFVTYPVSIHVPSLCTLLIEDVRIVGEMKTLHGSTTSITLNASLAEPIEVPMDKSRISVTNLLGSVVNSIASYRAPINVSLGQRLDSNKLSLSVKEYQEILKKEQRRFGKGFRDKLSTAANSTSHDGSNWINWDSPLFKLGTLESILGIGSAGSVIVFLVFAYCMCKSPSRSLPVAGTSALLAPLTSKLPTGYALPMTSIAAVTPALNFTTSVTETIGANSTKLSSRNITNTEVSIWNELKSHDYLIMLGVCMLLTIFLHYRIKRYLKLIFTRVTRRYPKNRGIIRRTGESDLVAHFLVKFYRVLGLDPVVRVMGVRVATLPGDITSWVVNPGSDNARFVQPDNRWYRFWSKQPVKLNWSVKTLCIKHKHNKKIETCQDMPGFLSLTNTDLYFGCEGYVPCLWWSAEVLSVMHMSLHQGTNSCMIFNRVDQHATIREQPTKESAFRNPTIDSYRSLLGDSQQLYRR